MGIRHPMFSIGEGTFREKEERLRKQGLLKKKKKGKIVKQKPLPPPTPPTGDSVWLPETIIKADKLVVGSIEPVSIMDKIWGNSKQVTKIKGGK